eukprot:1150244-Pelagomonas_calceolata.AAC.3
MQTTTTVWDAFLGQGLRQALLLNLMLSTRLVGCSAMSWSQADLAAKSQAEQWICWLLCQVPVSGRIG